MSTRPKFILGGTISGPGKLIIQGFEDIEITNTGSIETSSLQIDDLKLDGASRLSTRVRNEVDAMGGHLKRDLSSNTINLTGGDSGVHLKKEDIKGLREKQQASERDQQILAFFRAAKTNEKTKVAEMLALDKTLVNSLYKDWSPLHYACGAKPPALDVARLLIEYGADINYECGGSDETPAKTPLLRLPDKGIRKKLKTLAKKIQNSKVAEAPASKSTDKGDSKGAVDHGDSKSQAESKKAKDTDEAKRFEEIRQVIFSLDGMNYDSKSGDASTTFTTSASQITLPGKMHIISADKGYLAIRAIHAGKGAPGKLFVGVRVPHSRRILMIVAFEKQEDHDFYVNLDDVSIHPPRVQIYVLRTPIDYYLNPFLGIHRNRKKVEDTVFNFNCVEEDTWHDVLEVCHKYKTMTQPQDLLNFSVARINHINYEIEGDPKTIMYGTGDQQQIFHGWLYKMKADKGCLAMKATNLGKSGPGELSVGIRAPDTKKIFLITKLQKTEGHDFYANCADQQHSPPRGVFGVFRLPDPTAYNLKPCLTFQDKLTGAIGDGYIGCDENDTWHDVFEKVLRRSHSPTPERRS